MPEIRKPTEKEIRKMQCELLEQRISYLARVRRSPEYLRAIADAMEVVQNSAKDYNELS